MSVFVKDLKWQEGALVYTEWYSGIVNTAGWGLVNLKSLKANWLVVSKSKEVGWKEGILKKLIFSNLR